VGSQRKSRLYYEVEEVNDMSPVLSFDNGSEISLSHSNFDGEVVVHAVYFTPEGEELIVGCWDEQGGNRLPELVSWVNETLWNKGA
jgi:hypothetical protein